MIIGFVGSGQIGSTVARLAIEAGHDVVLSNSRGPESLSELVEALGPRATAATSSEAAQAGAIVVVSVPVAAFPSLASVPFAEKTLIDTCNYGPERDGNIAELDRKTLTSTEWLLQHTPGSNAVKAFNTIFYKHLWSLRRAAGALERSFLPIAGDSKSAKAEVVAFIESTGFGVVDSGPLAESWRQETGTPVWGKPYGPYSNENGRAADERTIRAALAAAER